MRTTSTRIVAMLMALAMAGCTIVPPVAPTPEGSKLATNPSLVQQLRTVPLDPERQTRGGEPTTALLLAVTLENTLTNFDYLQPIKTRPAHVVTVDLVKLDTPAFAITMDVAIQARYKVQSASGEVLFDKVISSQGQATPSDAFVGFRRLSLALQRAVQANVDNLMKEFDGLKIAPAK